MSKQDVLTPGQQEDPQTDTPGQQAQTPPTPQEDWKPRYDGAVRKMQELNETIKALHGQLGERSSEIEQLQEQLSTKDAEHGAFKSDFEKQFDNMKTEQEQTQAELNKLRASALKVEIAKELGHPELVTIADTFPDTNDRDLLKKAMQAVTEFAENRVKTREIELTSGNVPSVSAPPTRGLPQTSEEWERYIQSKSEGEERAQAWDLYFKSITQE